MRALSLASVALLGCSSTAQNLHGRDAECVVREDAACRVGAPEYRAGRPSQPSQWCYCRAHEVCAVPRTAWDPRVSPREWDDDAPIQPCSSLYPVTP